MERCRPEGAEPRPRCGLPSIRPEPGLSWQEALRSLRKTPGRCEWMSLGPWSNGRRLEGAEQRLPLRPTLERPGVGAALEGDLEDLKEDPGEA